MSPKTLVRFDKQVTFLMSKSTWIKLVAISYIWGSGGQVSSTIRSMLEQYIAQLLADWAENMPKQYKQFQNVREYVEKRVLLGERIDLNQIGDESDG
jgi:hypothetical protein